MKRKITLLLLAILFFVFVGCTKKTTVDTNKMGKTSINSSESSKDLKTATSSEEIKGTPNGKVEPEFDGKVIDNLSSYDKLSTSEQEKIIIDYLEKALGALVGDATEVNQMLKEKGYIDGEKKSLVALFNDIRSENSESDFNDIMIKLVQSIMEKTK